MRGRVGRLDVQRCEELGVGWGKARALLKDGISVTSESGEEVLPSQARRLLSQTPAASQQALSLKLPDAVQPYAGFVAKECNCPQLHLLIQARCRPPWTPVAAQQGPRLHLHVLSQMLVLHAKPSLSGRWWAPTALGDVWQ